jgi:hypothetical protein
VTQRAANTAVAVGGVVAGVLALALAALPPFPYPAWFVSWFTVAPFERWWYGLSDSHRSKLLYDTGTTLGTAAYPLIIALAFWFVARPLRQNKAKSIRTTLIVTAIFAIASSAWYITGWHYGLQYQGLRLLLIYVIVSLCWLALVVLGLVVARRNDSWWGHLSVQFALFVWLATFAFPWLGELI